MATWVGTINSNWSNAGNWQGNIPPSTTESAFISAGNVTVDATGLAAASISLFNNRTVDVGSGGGLAVTLAFAISSLSNLVVRNGGSVSASRYDVTGNLIVGGATAGVATASGTVTGAVNLQSGGKLIFNTNDQSTFSTAISGAGSVEHNGSGAGQFVTMSGTNTYTGSTTVNSGTLFVLDGNAIANTGAVVVNAPGTFSVLASETIGSLAGGGTVTLFNTSTLTTGGNDTNTTFSGVIQQQSFAANLTKIGTGTQTLSGANSYTGVTTVSAGVLAIANATALGTTAGGTSVTGGAALEISGGITVGGEALTLNGTGISSGGALRNISGANTYGGAITLGSATRMNSDAGNLTLTGGIGGTNQNLTLGGAGNFDVNSAIATGTGTLTKDGSGIAVLSVANTYTGATTVSAGVLRIGNATALGTTTNGTTVENNAALEIQGGITVGAEALTLNGTGISSGGALRNISGANTYGGAITLGSATRINSDAGNLTLTGGIGGTNQNLTLGGAGNFDVNSAIATGTGTLTKDGSGIAVLSVANSYTGATTVSAGVLRIGNANALGTTAGGTTVADGAALQISGGITVGAEALTLNGTGIDNLGALRNTGGANTYGGAITLGSDARIVADTSTALTLSGGISGADRNLSFGGIGNVTVNSAIATGAGTLTMAGFGTLTLSGANTYTGATTVNTGILALSGGSAIADSGAVILGFGSSPGALRVLNSETIGSLAGGSNTVELVSGTLTTGGNNTSTTVAGNISGSGNLIKTGTGTFTLSANNSYTGTTTVSAGVLELRGNGTLGTTAGGTTVADSAALHIFSTGSGTSEALTLNGTGIANGGALRITGGIVEVFGAITLGSATRINSDGGLNLKGGITGTNQNLTLGGSGEMTVASTIATGAGTLTKDGTGTVSLSGSNSYTGVTTVNEGVLRLNSGNAIADTGAVVVNAPGRLELFQSETIGSLAGDGAVILNANATNRDLTTGGNNASTTFSGVISNIASGGALTKIGTGVFTLSGANTYNGVTTVSGGTLALSGGAAIADASAVVVNAAGTLRVNNTETIGSLAGSGGVSLLNDSTLTTGGNGSSTTFSGVISGDGGLAKTGSGTMTLSGVNTFSGETTILGGTLALSGTGSIANSVVVILENGARFDISGTTSGATVTDLFSGSTGNVILGGKSLTVTATFDDLGPINFTGGAGADALNFTVRADQTSQMLAGVTFTSWTAGIDTVTLNGNALNNTLTGTSQADTINGLGGNDTLVGGAGADVLNGGVGADALDGGEDFDLASYAAAAAGVYARLDGVAESGGEAVGDSFVSIEGFMGSAFTDYFVGRAALGDRLMGQGGNDFLYGMGSGDVLIGGLGGDYLDGGADFDYASYIFATAGVFARLDGLAGSGGEAVGDTFLSIEGLIGSTLGDTLVGSNSNDDQVFGQDGADSLYGVAGNDTLTGGVGADYLDGGAGFDLASYSQATTGVYARLDGLNESSSEAVGDVFVSIEGFIGSFNDDVFVGKATNDDALYGLGGVDTLYGIGGNDTLNGGAGNDILFGGTGNDFFIFGDALNAASNVDDIRDFTPNADDMLLSRQIFTGIGASLDTAELQLGSAANDAGDRIIYNSATGQLFFDPDGNNAAAPTLFATVMATTALTIADFIMFG